MEDDKKKYEIPEEVSAIVLESQSSWGGSWTEQKLDCFESYVKAYLTIMNIYRDKYNWKLIYFDGFAGSGSRTVEDQKAEIEKSYGIFGEEKVDARDFNVYQGAAERVVRLEDKMRGFDFYYFIDLNENNCTRLDLKLSQYPTKGYKMVRQGDANDQTKKLGEALKRDSHLKALALLDPFGMSIEWSTIESIAGKNIDLWILLPSGVIINRLLGKDGKLMYPEKLERFFGLPKQVIVDWFYNHHQEQGLFGEMQEWYEKKGNSIERISDLFCEQLGTLFPYVTSQPLIMKNRNNVPIFHFVCASFNETAVKIAQQIINKRQ